MDLGATVARNNECIQEYSYYCPHSDFSGMLAKVVQQRRGHKRESSESVTQQNHTFCPTLGDILILYTTRSTPQNVGWKAVILGSCCPCGWPTFLIYLAASVSPHQGLAIARRSTSSER